MERLDRSDFNVVLWLIRHVPVFGRLDPAGQRVYGPPVTLNASAENEATSLGGNFAKQLSAVSGIRADVDSINSWPLFSSPFPRCLQTAAGFVRGMELASDCAEPPFEHVPHEDPSFDFDKYVSLFSADPKVHGASTLGDLLRAVDSRLRAIPGPTRARAIQRFMLSNSPSWKPLRDWVVQAYRDAAVRERKIAITPALADFAMPDPFWWGELTREYKSRPRDQDPADTPLDEKDLASISLLRQFLTQRLADTAHPFQFMFTHDSVLRAAVVIANDQHPATRRDLHEAGNFPPGTILGIKVWNGTIVSIREFPIGSERSPLEPSKELLRRQTDFFDPGYWAPYTIDGPIYQPAVGTPRLDPGTFHPGFPVTGKRDPTMGQQIPPFTLLQDNVEGHEMS